MSEYVKRDRRAATAGRSIGNPPCYVISGSNPPDAEPYLTLDGQMATFDLPAAVRLGVRCGHPDVAPLEMLVKTPAGRWVLLSDAAGWGTEQGTRPPSRELSRPEAARWMVANGHAIPDDLAAVDPADAAEHGGGAAEAGRACDAETRLGASLRKRRKFKQAALVEYMIGRESADVEDVAVEVHGDREISEGAIGANCRRATSEAELDGVLFSYRLIGATVWKDPR